MLSIYCLFARLETHRSAFDGNPEMDERKALCTTRTESKTPRETPLEHPRQEEARH